ncbi:hypothetical protein ANN_19516 [Periplaneta americana]|uniref:Uncharacterized protein n=1 Tax=Periplaneta americana TaxID=6978 RepID=A0ABQ8SAB3_PERAM|nr:hypothetical protein ANN_19516 [Periplaneta americana]
MARFMIELIENSCTVVDRYEETTLDVGEGSNCGSSDSDTDLKTLALATAAHTEGMECGSPKRKSIYEWDRTLRDNGSLISKTGKHSKKHVAKMTVDQVPYINMCHIAVEIWQRHGAVNNTICKGNQYFCTSGAIYIHTLHAFYPTSIIATFCSVISELIPPKNYSVFITRASPSFVMFDIFFREVIMA